MTLHPTVGFLMGLSSWRARTFYVMSRVVERLTGLGRLNAYLRAGISGPYSHEGMIANLRPHTLDAWIFHPLYERETRKWLDANLTGRFGVLFDVGAHCGSVSLRHRLSFETIVALEPNPADYRALVDNVGLSRANNIIPLNVAASNSPGRVRLYLGSPGTHSLIQKVDAAYVDVEATTLDNLVVKNGWMPTDIRLIKIDVEGTELDVLKGCQNILATGHPTIVVEANTASHAEALRHFLRPYGFDEIAQFDIRNLIFQKRH